MNKITYGIIGFLSLIVAGLGGTIYLSEDQFDNAYICSINQEIVIAENLSSTAKTAYWIEENVLKSKVCRNGYWLPLKQYVKDNNIDINILLKQLNKEEYVNNYTIQSKQLKYKCDQKSCISIENEK